MLFIKLQNKGYVIQVTEREILKQRVTEICSNQEQADAKMFPAAKLVGSRSCNKFSIKNSYNPYVVLSSLCYQSHYI